MCVCGGSGGGMCVRAVVAMMMIEMLLSNTSSYARHQKASPCRISLPLLCSLDLGKGWSSKVFFLVIYLAFGERKPTY